MIARTNNHMLIKNFIEFSSNLNALDSMHRTPLYVAAKSNSVSVAVVRNSVYTVGVDQVWSEGAHS